MRADELRRMSEDELVAEVGRLKREQMNLRFRAVEEEEAGGAQLRTVRRDVARAMTVLAERRRIAAAAK